MHMCPHCRAGVEPGRSHCPICDMPVALPYDPTQVGATPTAPPGTPTPVGGVPAVPTPAPWPTAAPPAPGYSALPHPNPAGVYPPTGYAAPIGYAPVYPVVPVVAPPKSKAAAALLCFFLGGLGIHRFYTGQTGLGLAILLTSLILGPLTLGLWYIVTFVWLLVDFILILAGGVRDQYGRPLV